MMSFQQPQPSGMETSVSAKLPSNLHSVYLNLKQKTDRLALWLIENGKADDAITTASQVRRDCEVAELSAFANTIVARKISIPASILGALEFTINARTEISIWYKQFFKGSQKERKKNRGHDHFTLM